MSDRKPGPGQNGVYLSHHARALPPMPQPVANLRNRGGVLGRIVVQSDGAVKVLGPIGTVTTVPGAWVPNRLNRIELIFDMRGPRLFRVRTQWPNVHETAGRSRMHAAYRHKNRGGR